MTSSQEAVVASRRRELWVDNLRVVVIAGVIVIHAATGYVIDIAGWYYDDERDASGIFSLVLTVPGLLGALFFLGPLFLVAGWFSARSLAHRGTGGFVRTRLLRLGVPLLAFVLFIQPLTDYVGNIWDERGSFVFYLRSTEVGAMWFVAALLVFSLVYAGLRHVRPAAQSHRPPGLGLLVIAIVTIAVTSFAVWQIWPLTSEAVLNLKFAEWPQGAVLFALGVRAAEAGWVDELSLDRLRWLGWAAAAGMVAFVALLAVGVSAGAEDLGPGTGWPMMAVAFLDGVIAVTFTVWFVVWFRGRWPRHGVLMGKAARGSYATYFIHPLVLTCLMLLCAPVAAGVWIKFLLVAAVGVPACFMVGYGLTRVPGLSKVL